MMYRCLWKCQAPASSVVDLSGPSDCCPLQLEMAPKLCTPMGVQVPQMGVSENWVPLF